MAKKCYLPRWSSAHSKPILTMHGGYAISVIENVFQLRCKMELTAKSIEGIMRREGYKLTPQRRAVLNAIDLSHDHLTPADIYRKARREHSGIGLVTVYRTLDILDRLGLICEVHSAGNGRSCLMRRPREHHHHIVCSECGTVEDFTDCDLSELEQRLSRETGFEIESHILEFSGHCRNGRRAAPS